MSGNAATIMPGEHQAKLESSELVSTLMQNDQRKAVNGIDGLVGGGLANLSTLALAINGLKGVKNYQTTDHDDKCTCNRSTKGNWLDIKYVFW